MPKLKTNKAAKKRYKYTATGKVKRTKSNRRHLLANKTKNKWLNHFFLNHLFRRTVMAALYSNAVGI